MTQEDKELLLKDLCTRLPYGVIGLYTCNCKKSYDKELTGTLCDVLKSLWNPTWSSTEDRQFLPYLRPMSSMTEEEEKEYLSIDNRSYSCPMAYAHVPASDRIDWLNAHHFDYHGLIPKGLALEAPDEMYN